MRPSLLVDGQVDDERRAKAGFGIDVVEVEALVSWDAQRIAIATEVGDDDARVWSQRGWTAFTTDDTTGIFAALEAAFGKKG